MLILVYPVIFIIFFAILILYVTVFPKPRWASSIILYFLLLVPSLIIWWILSLFIGSYTYYCSDDFMGMITGPPFVHGGEGDCSINYVEEAADCYLNGMTETKLTLIWYLLIVAIIITPVILQYTIAALCNTVKKIIK